MESPAVTVALPGALRERTGSQPRVVVNGSTIREVVDALEYQYPGLRFNLCYETGELRPFVNVFVRGQNVRYLQGLDTPVPAGATIHILPSVAGG
jgi:molybdopterin synthase sulfur carrier subunit